jgi:hypothetical protein
MQVPEQDRKSLAKAVKELGFAAKEVTSNPAYRLFLGSGN